MYCLDTSVLINGWNRHYPISIPHFAPIWDAIANDIRAGGSLVSWEVWKEVKKQDDELLTWLSDVKDLIERPRSAEIKELQSVMRRFPNFAAERGSALNAADPWVVAMALANDAIVVTYEEATAARPKATRPPMMPHACDEMRVKWCAPAEYVGKILSA